MNDNDPEVTYSGGMAQHMFPGYYQGDFHTSIRPGEWASFSFVGTGVRWIGAKNGDHGDADVYIDGNLAGSMNTKADAWLKQQEIYTKTGLPYGPHTLKVVIKTPGYQDFDAFAYLAPAPRQAAAPRIEGVMLPAQVPYLNTPQRYPVGNGVAAAVCGPDSVWQQLCGPGYTSANYIESEDLVLDLDGTELPMNVPMQRAARTGVFYGVATRGDLDIGIVDFSCAGQPWISRLVLVTNTSAMKAHDVVLRAHVQVKSDNGYTHWIVEDAGGGRAGIGIQADKNTGVPFGGNNPYDKSATIAFADPASSAYFSGNTGIVEAPPQHLAPQARYETALEHYVRGGHGMSDSACIAALRALDNRANLGKSIDAWQAWYRDVPAAYRLSRVKDDRARELMEGASMVLKTNQSADGGVIAHTTFYKEGYVRDAAMAIRGLLAAGHSPEAKAWLLWIDKKLSIHHHLGDAMNCEVSLDEPSYTFDMGNMDVEEPGWVLLVARDYYRQTHDLDFLKSIDRTLRYCADIQLKDAAANGDKLEFNGDETEICGAVDIHSTGCTGGSDAQQHEWSLSSVAMAAASVDFYREYIKACGGDPANYHNAQTDTTMDLNAYVKDLVAAMDRDFWRTDVPGSPGGFHDFFRMKAGDSWPKARDVNFTLMPVFFGTPYAAQEQAKDVDAIARLFDQKTGFLQLVPSADSGMEGQDLGYLLWDLVQIGDWRKELACHALVNGPTVDCWGSFNEAYDNGGHPNDHDLRSLETGINLSALSKYWGLGQ